MNSATAKSFTAAQRAMVLASEPDDITGREGIGVELSTAQHHSTAKALARRRLGHYVAGGFSLAMYWNNPYGLLARDELLRMSMATP